MSTYDLPNRLEPAALVIGGGIAGIQAALDIADGGFQVTLVERSASIGGRMAQLDKTFPTLDCSSCILTPKMVDVSRHPNIQLLTYSEVAKVSGQMGDFQVQIRRKPRYVDESKCRGCGLCAEACRLNGRVRGDPLTEFNAGIAKRAAIYVPFPQAVPLIYTVDPEACVYLTRGVCGKTFKCQEACTAGAIDFTQSEQLIEVNVSTIVIATGYDVFDARRKPEFGYGVYPQVITTLEFERLASASGPTAGKIRLNEHQPEKLVFIQCVGSRDLSIDLPNCSRVCCMAVAKQAHLAHDRLPGAEITVLYMDIRAFGKGFEEFYDRVRHEGVLYRRGNPSEIIRRGENLVVRAEDTLLGELVEIEADLVVLAVGMQPRREADGFAQAIKLARGEDGYFLEQHPKLQTVESSLPGVFLAGCCQGPKDIPDTVAHAKAAASAALISLAKMRGEPAILVGIGASYATN
ncbi:MAG: CoB--CoM heterodisulfide reductase iron-sulfur subunit A family protein [Anaerolineales bacterium]|nr:MAG: CoB--CoM heterodisulfide reductase iron-sulfur subunit A family protein [Anaerolineales bacterium]